MSKVIDFTVYKNTRKVVTPPSADVLLLERLVAMARQNPPKHAVKPQDVKTYTPPTLPRKQES